MPHPMRRNIRPSLPSLGEFDRDGRKRTKRKGTSMASLALGGVPKNPFLVAAMLTATLPLVGCYTPGERAAGGGVIGGLAGAAVGTAGTGGAARPGFAYSAPG